MLKFLNFLRLPHWACQIFYSVSERTFCTAVFTMRISWVSDMASLLCRYFPILPSPSGFQLTSIPLQLAIFSFISTSFLSRIVHFRLCLLSLLRHTGKNRRTPV